MMRRGFSGDGAVVRQICGKARIGTSAVAAIGLGVALLALGGCSSHRQVSAQPPAPEASDNGVSMEQRMNALQATLDQMREEQHQEQQRYQQQLMLQQQQIQTLQQHPAARVPAQGQAAYGAAQPGSGATQPPGAAQEAGQAAPETTAQSGSTGSTLLDVFPAFQWYDPSAPKVRPDPHGPDERWKPD